MVDMKKNVYLINAPAGSGKTTTIKKMLDEISANNKDENILCITYTNRAADELIKDIESSNITIKTIHSFINSFISIYFTNEDIINLFIETYSEDINKRIENKDEKETINNSNLKYIEKFGALTFEAVLSNISKIEYNELSFNSLYYGGLGHDDLLDFSYKIIKKYPKIQKRLTQKYKYIFIDEYQDTSANVLNLFYDSIQDSQTELFLFGDKMQQIYENYDGSFDNKLESFDTSIKLSTNYRSSSKIINLLNYIYNDVNCKQYPKETVPTVRAQLDPLYYLSDDINETVSLISNNYESILRLFIFNSQRFKTIGAGKLYSAVNSMEKYGFSKKYSATDVLIDMDETNPDPLMIFLYDINRLLVYFTDKRYGIVIQQILKNRHYNNKILKINEHTDKVKINEILNEVLNAFNSNISIGEFINHLIKANLLMFNDIDQFIDSEEYKTILNIDIEEFRNLYTYLINPTVSTQHGVKGEGHKAVCFVAQDSSLPMVKMYDFFRLWAEVDINFTDFQKFYYIIKEDFINIENKIASKISDLKKPSYETHRSSLETEIEKLLSKYNSNIYFNNIYSDKIDAYKLKPGVGKLKLCFKINDTFGILSAYRLFYVGCSRAIELLVAVIDNQKIEDYRDKLIIKLESGGFVRKS